MTAVTPAQPVASDRRAQWVVDSAPSSTVADKGLVVDEGEIDEG